MQPCPYCILQRVIFVVIALLCLVGAFTPGHIRQGFAGLAAVLAVLGGAAAVYQHFVAAKSASCNLTLADKIINALDIEALWPTVFAVRGSCADAAVSILGVPFEFWSLALAAVIAVVTLRVVVRG
jgi:disulfide bond formation protein DsbB